MEQENNKNGVIILLVFIIVILLTLVVLFATGTISLKKMENDNNRTDKTTVENNITDTTDTTNNSSNHVNENNNTNDSNQIDSTNSNEYTIKAMTKAKENLQWDDVVYEITIVDGNLKIDDNTFSIPDEKIKYFYINRYQCGHGIVFYYLTENGNVYVTDMVTGIPDKKIETLINFTKLDYSNVTDIVVIQNDNYGKPMDEVSGKKDNVREYLYALIEGVTYKLGHQYRC